MSTGGSENNQVEDTTAKDPETDASKPYVPISPGDTTSNSPHEEPNDFEPTVQSDITEDVGIDIDIKDRETLSEVRSSLQRIGNGVEELATTVQDLLGLSDLDDDSDYVPGPGGRREFSWARLKSHAKRRRRRRQELRNAQGHSQSPSTDDDQESDIERSKLSKDIIAETRKCNLEQFQSRAAGDGHKLYCVDFLVADDSLDEDVQRFKETVTDIESGKIEFWKPDHTTSRTDASPSETTGEKWIRQIRINSRAVMEILRHAFPQLKGYRGQSTVFKRPFQLLVSLHEEIREQLTNIQGLASDNPSDGSNPSDSNTSVELGMTRTPDWEDPIQELCRNKDALNELVCYVDFMENQIMPDSRRYRNESSPLPETIRWEDLWYLFKPGDLIYVKRDTESFDAFTSSEFAQQILRVMHTSLTDTSPTLGPIGVPGVSEQFSIFGHFIDFNGGTYFAMYHIFRPILPFRGQMKVTDLPIYPVSYVEDDQILAQAVSDGETYVSLIERRSGFYSGWTQTISPLGNPLGQRMAEQTRLAGPQHIESDILVDFEETFNAFPEWRPRTYVMKIGPFDVDVCRLEQSDLPVLEWDEMGQTKHDDCDQVLLTDYTEWREAKKFMAEDLMWDFKLARNRPAPTGKHLALLPRRFFAYAVLERKFVPLNTRSVRSADAEADDQAFKKLEIDCSYKRLILSLVKSHFDKVEAEKTQNVEIETQDLIRGKGKGVVILLHGAPGVGKTATAEAVALKWKKPLFPITCGDLGYTADTLERSLNEIFRVAHHWDCILLLDEADVFITQRERNDLKRNALVSTFLRVLEYYNGIMFLTTNRAGVLDEAIKSRVHLNLFYDHLTEEQTVAIFKQHIQRLRDIEKQRNPDPNERIWVDYKEIIQFARDHFNERDNTHGSGNNFGRWNGRQIRNAFLIASSLAHYDSDEDGDDEDKDELAEPSRKKQKQLGRSQFEVVAKTTLMYDQYRATVHSGKSDDHIAFEREERAMSSQPRSPTPVRMKNIGRSLN